MKSTPYLTRYARRTVSGGSCARLKTWIWPLKAALPFGLVDGERQKRRDQRGTKRASQAREPIKRNVPPVTYADVCGQEEAVEAVRDMVELPLLHADLFRRVGISDAGAGIILAGAPGTGKTLLARAVAGESKAHIEIVAGPELLSKWFGESERQLRPVFRRARELEPSVILFDELDGIAGRRNGDPLQRTFVAQLLTLLDGIEDRGRVFAIATTNRPDDIDPALRRPQGASTGSSAWISPGRPAARRSSITTPSA